MIRVENIHVAFDRVLIDDGLLEIEAGKLTVIKGKSGSGKTSLLSVVGLLTNNKSSKYAFNGYYLNDDDQEISLFRKKHIGYVFQDNSLLEHLSIYENFKFYQTMVGMEISEEEVRSLLVEVQLDKDIHQDISTLSGGEKQRLAIACAISKHPELLILDEPTSALDAVNRQMIIDILKQLAHNGMMILIASHDKDVIDQCDVVYEIKNQKLIYNGVINQEDTSQFTLKPIKLKSSFYISYFVNYMKANLLNYVLMFVMCAISIAMVVSSNSISKGYEKKQLENMDALGNREIFVTSEKNHNGEAKYNIELPSMNDAVINGIQKNSLCESCYPFYEGYSKEIYYQNQSYLVHCAIQPYTKEKRLKDFVERGQTKENGVYLSFQLANALEIVDFDATTISLTMLLPDGNKLELENLVIDSVLESSLKNRYSSYENVIYLPINQLPTMKETQALLIYAMHYDDTENLKADIRSLDSQLGTFSIFSRVSEMNMALDNMKAFAPFLMVMLSVVSMMMIFLIFSRYISNRKKEILLLKVNGLSKVELIQLFLSELLIETMLVAITAIIFTISLYGYLYIGQSLLIEMNIVKDMALIIFVSFVMMALPSFIMLYLFQRLDMADALRND